MRLFPGRLFLSVLLAVVFAAAIPVSGQLRRRSPERPDVIEIGERIAISTEVLREEMKKNVALRDYIELYGWPDVAEVQEIAVDKPWAAYEVHLYYLRRLRHLVFGRVYVSPEFVDFGMKKYDGRMTEADIARLLGSPPTPTATPAPTPPPPSPPPLPPVRERRIVLRGVYFDFDRADIRPDARPVLDEAIQVLRARPDAKLVVEGHTDSVGGEEYNQALSLRRAEAVKNYLVAGGVAPERITVVGYGETRPVASNDTEEGRAQNRRVELRLGES